MTDTTLPLSTKDSGAITVDDHGKLAYPSTGGYEEIQIPSLRGSPRETETLHLKDFGLVTAARIEASLNKQGYMGTGPQQKPSEVLRFFTAVAKGAGIMDSATLHRMKELGDEFEREPEQAEYYRQVVRPWLFSLASRKR